MISAGKLKRYLEEHNITISQLSSLTGINEASLKFILRNNGLNSTNLNTLCKILNKQPCELISYEDESRNVTEIKKLYAILSDTEKTNLKEWIANLEAKK